MKIRYDISHQIIYYSKGKKKQNAFFISLNQFVPNSNFSIRWSEYGLQMNVAC